MRLLLDVIWLVLAGFWMCLARVWATATEPPPYVPEV